jgi:hypothetical protein
MNDTVLLNLTHLPSYGTDSLYLYILNANACRTIKPTIFTDLNAVQEQQGQSAKLIQASLFAFG